MKLRGIDRDGMDAVIKEISDVGASLSDQMSDKDKAIVVTLFETASTDLQQLGSAEAAGDKLVDDAPSIEVLACLAVAERLCARAIEIINKEHAEYDASVAETTETQEQDSE